MIQRRSPRLKHWDYSTPDWYFVTVVTRLRRELFGTIDECGVMSRSELGTVAEAEWWRSASLLADAKSYVFVLMPNHVHGIVWLNLGTDHTTSRTRLSTFVGGYKAAVTRRAGRPIWQRGYYDRIIRDERELEAAWNYIEANPAKWAEDHENPVLTQWARQVSPLR